MKIAVDLHFSNLKDGLYTDMGSEGRWGTRWAELLARNGCYVDCICSENVYGWGSSSPVPNVNFVNKEPKRRYDIALLPGPEVPRGVEADLYIFMHFSPLTITSKDRELYKSDNSIIVYPVEIQFLSTKYPNAWKDKTYFMPIPVAEAMQPPDYNRIPSIAWTERWGPGLTSDINFNSFIRLAKIYNLHARIFSYQNFYVHIKENEHEEGARKIEEQLNSLCSTERIPSMPSNQLIEKLKVTKLALSTHGGGLGGSIYEQVASGAFPLPSTGTNYMFPYIDSRLYDNPYPNTVEEVVKNWEIPLNDKSFYISSIKEYQKEIESHLYDNCLTQFSKIISNYGFKLR